MASPPSNLISRHQADISWPVAVVLDIHDLLHHRARPWIPGAFDPPSSSSHSILLSFSRRFHPDPLAPPALPFKAPERLSPALARLAPKAGSSGLLPKVPFEMQQLHTV